MDESQRDEAWDQICAATYSSRLLTWMIGRVFRGEEVEEDWEIPKPLDLHPMRDSKPETNQEGDKAAALEADRFKTMMQHAMAIPDVEAREAYLKKVLK